MDRLLVCIAFHYSEERLKYLSEVLTNFYENYTCEIQIIIDTNLDAFTREEYRLMKGLRTKIIAHPNLSHPFHLTWMHREHIKREIGNYDAFMYIEDDILLPYANYLNYLENFKLLWPLYVPSFVRIEEKDGEQFVSDIPKQIEPFDGLYHIESSTGKVFAKIPFPINYHGFWIMPQKELKESMKPDFVRLTDGREFAAMYVGWELGKPTLIELENGMISKKCYSYHLPNNYAFGDCANGKIKPENIFI